MNAPAKYASVAVLKIRHIFAIRSLTADKKQS
jgi:hypothetical protein